MVQCSELAVHLDRSSEEPLYQQLHRQVSRLIASGQLASGTRLPASRVLAEQLGVNRATVAGAYDLLVADGMARSHVGQGTFVAGGSETRPPSPFRWPFSRAAEAVRREWRQGAPPPLHSDPIDFASLVPDQELFPIAPFREALDAVLARDGKQLLQYGPAAGHEPLRHYIASRLAERGVGVTADEVQIVNGSQQGLDLLFRTLVDPGDTVVVESPTYSVVLPVLAQYQARVAAIPMTVRGMDLEVLEAELARGPVKCAYTMPTFHNPTGITMDLDSRQQMLDLGARYRIPIIEDDFESDLRFDGRELPPLKALDATGLVVYLGTFSKGLFPGLRLGWIVAPREVIETLSRTKMFSDYHSSSVLQAAVLEFCRRGFYEEHIRNLTRVYRKKKQRLVEAMVRHFPAEVRWTEPEGGYAFWVTLPEGLSSQVLLSEAAGAGVVFTAGSHFFTGSEGERYFRLSISRVPLDRIEEGVSRLGETIHRLLAAERGAPSPGRVRQATFLI